MMFAMIATALVGIVAGGGIGWALHKFQNARTLRLAQEEAQEILDETKQAIEFKHLEEKERTQEIEMEMWTKVEPDMLKTEGSIEDLQEVANEKKSKADQLVQEEKKKLQEREVDVKKQEQALKGQEAELSKIKDASKALNNAFVEKLTAKLETSVESVKEQLKTKMEEDAQKRALRLTQEHEEDMKEHAETRAKKILALIIDRFSRPYCSERGIGAVNFPDAQTRKIFCDPEGNNIKAVQESCGCDIVIEENSELVGVAGFDPVRRELTRRTLERLFKEKKNITPEVVRRIAESQKKELFKSIKHDGDALAKELKLEGLNAEIRQMMGSLRYRYSFTQNQYFQQL